MLSILGSVVGLIEVRTWGIRVHDLVSIDVIWQNTGHSYLPSHWLSYSTRLFKLSVLFCIDHHFQHSINQPLSAHNGSY